MQLIFKFDHFFQISSDQQTLVLTLSKFLIVLPHSGVLDKRGSKINGMEQLTFLSIQAKNQKYNLTSTNICFLF